MNSLSLRSTYCREVPGCLDLLAVGGLAAGGGGLGFRGIFCSSFLGMGVGGLCLGTGGRLGDVWVLDRESAIPDMWVDRTIFAGLGSGRLGLL